MGEIDGSFRSWGLSRGGTGAVSNAIGDAARRFGAEIRTNSPVAKILTKNGRATGVVLENGDELHANAVVSSADPRLTFEHWLDPMELPADFMARRASLQVPRLVGQGQPRARRPAELHLPAGRRAAPARRDFDLAQRRLHGTRLRRCQVRSVLAAAVHRHRDSVADRYVARAARETRDVVFRAIRAVRVAAGGNGTGGTGNHMRAAQLRSGTCSERRSGTP